MVALNSCKFCEKAIKGYCGQKSDGMENGSFELEIHIRKVKSTAISSILATNNP